MDVTVRFGSAFMREDGPRMVADVGRCLLVQTDEGASRLDFPSGLVLPATATHRTAVSTTHLQATWSISQSSGEPMIGAIDLLRSSDNPIPFPKPNPGGDAVDDALRAYIQLAGFFFQPFDVLPRRLTATVAGSEPAPPAVIELSDELVKSPSIAITGGIRGQNGVIGGLFACRLTLTDAGRVKLRAALARQSHFPTTEPSGSAAGAPATSPAR